jgi:hypothetical protein
VSTHQKASQYIALDPGGTTGCCVWTDVDARGNYHGDVEFELSQLGPEEHHRALWKKLTGLDPEVVICESFNYRNAYRDKVVLDSREYIGIARLYCASTHKRFVLQQPSAAKGLWTDAKIKSLNLWQPGHPHAMDALRHMLYYLTVEVKNLKWVRRLNTMRSTI